MLLLPYRNKAAQAPAPIPALALALVAWPRPVALLDSIGPIFIVIVVLILESGSRIVPEPGTANAEPNPKTISERGLPGVLRQREKTQHYIYKLPINRQRAAATRIIQQPV